MGNRANIVLVDHDGWQLRYSHWAGCRMLDALLAGPELAKRYVLAQKREDFWTDELWADGGLVLDVVERKLLFFGEELMVSMNERRAIFEVLALTWPGYSLAWAYDGAAEIAAYVGAEFPLRDKPSRPELIHATDAARLHHLVTVVGADGAVRAWPLYWGSSAAWHGPGLLDLLPGPGEIALDLGVLPESGVHVDDPAKTLGVWRTSAVPGLSRWLPKLWPGWHIEDWSDRYEEHLLRCGPNITAPELDIVSGVGEVENWLKQRVYQSFSDSPAGHIMALAAMFGAEEPDQQEQSKAIYQTGERPSLQEWAQFERACAQVRMRAAP